MNTMFQVDNYFARISQEAVRLKLTVWNVEGHKLVSDYISAASLERVWNNIADLTSDKVVEVVQEKLKG